MLDISMKVTIYEPVTQRRIQEGIPTILNEYLHF